jgi:hypothetical protein
MNALPVAFVVLASEHRGRPGRVVRRRDTGLDAYFAMRVDPSKFDPS